MSDAHVWDASSVAALDAITQKFAAHGVDVSITGLNEPSAAMHGRLAGRLSAEG